MGAGEVNRREFFSDDLKNTRWLGEVINNDDPDNFTGRIKVKVFGKFDELEEEDIPWAYPTGYYSGGSATGSGTFSLPKIGSIVSVTFDNGNIYHPEYRFQQGISDELKEEIGNEDDYLTAHSLVYDTEIEGGLRLFYTSTQGLIIKLGNNMIRLASDNTISITNKANDNNSYEIENGNSIVIDPDGNLLIDIDTDRIINIGGGNEINITADNNITIDGKEEINITGEAKLITDKRIISSSSIHLGSDNAAEPIALGDTLKANLEKLSARVDDLKNVFINASFSTDYSGAALYASQAAAAAAIVNREDWSGILSNVSNTD